MKSLTSRPYRSRIGATVVLAAVALAGCTGASPSATSPGSSNGTQSAAGSVGASTSPPNTSGAPATDQVLPVTQNPITNTATTPGLKIDSVLVENNVDPSTGKTASDHLEIALQNTGTSELKGVEVYYTFTDPTAKAVENYYLKLPDTYTIPAGGKRLVNFSDKATGPDYFPVNKFSLYYASKNALDVEVTVSATGVGVQNVKLKKDAGGPEAAD